MKTILSYPPLAGMVYPKLEETGQVLVVDGPQAVAGLSQDQRQAVRVLMTSATRGCSADLAASLPSLGFVISQGAGSDKIDIAEFEKRGIKVRCVGEALTDDVADLAMTLTIMLCRDLVRADAFARNGAWERGRFEVGDSPVGMTVGVGGLSGRIGQAIAARASASKMRIAGLKRSSNEGLGATLHDGWEALAAASDVLVLAVPGTPDLKDVIGAKELAALGPKGRLVNVGRGNLVDTQALITALENKTIAGAALDVLDTEPVIPAQLSALPNVILTPHIGGQTWGQRSRGARIAEDEVLAFLAAKAH